ncbi:MAG: type I restriction endonuclease [Melioribacteraceae bacterium]
MKFNEDTRVKIPSILHLTRLGYRYLSLKDSTWDVETNIFTNIFTDSIARINNDIEKDDVKRLLQDISLELDNEDLGKAFYLRLIGSSGIKLIDFEDFNNNNFHVVTELTYKNGDEEFRPDITLVINGLPLIFIEVKKPNNRDGIIAERERINKRFQNSKFRRFINITQLMVFSNNMEYDNEQLTPIQGVFYSTPSYQSPVFNYFREEEKFDLNNLLHPENDDLENFVLKDNNLQAIKNSPEFITNKNPNTPTNRVSTSLFSRERLAFILKYALVYVQEQKGLEKHIMRYPQLFATKAIERKLNQNIKKGIIWHTQGSGKTALAFYNVRFLTDYFQKSNIIPKFYFIVDRLDLLIQAQIEFVSRGLVVHTVNSKDEFRNDIKQIAALHNNSGKLEITVVNIQKFSDDSTVVNQIDYDINIQRIYFLDEVHRSYNPEGSFLANLTESDKNSIKIGLTGTPLIGDDKNSRALFGNYIHKYYYNMSIADGYTLKLIREDIETKYKIELEDALKEIEILQGDAERRVIYSHKKFVKPMLKYIVDDFEKSRVMHNDNTIGGMVVCDSADQAKEMFEIFNETYFSNDNSEKEFPLAADKTVEYNHKNKVKNAALILHDVGTKDERKKQIEDFKDGKIDLLFVFNMLLTGFDSRRLKKLYLGRIIRRHNLLQTLTRVNRTYKDFRYGYIVDFADIRKEFDATNKAYFEELQEELGDEISTYSNLFKTKEEIEEELNELKEILFKFDTQNAEIFSQQISQIEDRQTMLAIKKALGNARSLYNLIRLFGHYELLETLDFKKLSKLYIEAENHLALLNLKENLQGNIEATNLLNVALENVIFKFTKLSEEELVIADKLKDTLRRTREELGNNIDKKDPEFVNLYEELKRLFKERNLDEITQEEMKENIVTLNNIYEAIKELNRKNELLNKKYENDPKYIRIHKRILEKNDITEKEIKIHEALKAVKSDADSQVLKMNKLLENEGYFNSMMQKIVINQFLNQNKIKIDADTSRFINSLVVKEYINEFNGYIV